MIHESVRERLAPGSEFKRLNGGPLTWIESELGRPSRPEKPLPLYRSARQLQVALHGLVGHSGLAPLLVRGGEVEIDRRIHRPGEVNLNDTRLSDDQS